MKRVAIVVRGFDLHGAVANSSLHHAEALSTEHDVTIITDTGPTAVRQLRHQLRVQRIRILSLRWLRRYAHVPSDCLFILATGFYFLSGRERNRYDVVIFHSHPSTALLSPIMKRLLGCKTVMAMHGDIFDRPVGTYDPRLTFWYKITTGRAYRVVDAVIALSPYMRNFAVAGGAHPNKVYIVPNGVDPAEIGLDQQGYGQDHLSPQTSQMLQILFIGRIEYNKGVDLLVQALARLKTLFPNVFLNCIGASNPTFLRSLRYQIAALGVEDAVNFIPPISRKELGSYYRSSTVVAIPSRSETQSTVLMESMAAGKPVVASDTGGNSMMVKVNETGLLFPTGEVEGLFNALKQLLSDHKLRLLMGEAAQHRYLEHYSLEKTASNLRQAFDNIVESCPSSPQS